jgi:hypothetical protein
MRQSMNAARSVTCLFFWMGADSGKLRAFRIIVESVKFYFKVDMCNLMYGVR